MDIDAIKRAAAMAAPRIRPIERPDGEFYVMLVDRDIYWRWTQEAWNNALASAKRQLAKLRYW